MRAFFGAWVWALPTLAAAAIIPPPVPVHRDHVEPAETNRAVLKLDLQDYQAKATITIPCIGCLGHESRRVDDEALLLNFEVFSSDRPCGISNVTLNGKYLAQEWDGIYAQGEGSFLGVPDLDKDDWLRQHDLDLSWESACLYDADSEVGEILQGEDVAQALTVTIKRIDGREIEQPSGFTISFKQLSPPELLRLSVVPDSTASKKEFAEAWRNPPPHLRLYGLPQETSTDPVAEPGYPSIEDQIRELRALQAEARELRRSIHEKKQHIKAQLRHEAKHFKHELKQCDSISCIIKTIAHKAHGTVRVLYIRFGPSHHPPHRHEEMGMPVEHDQYQAMWHAQSEQQSPEAVTDSSTPPPPPHHEKPPPCHGNRTHTHPPPPPPPPPHRGHDHHDPLSLPPPPPPHGGHDHHGPPNHPPPGPWDNHNPLITALKVLAGALGLTALLAFLHRRCCNIRTRTDRRARREERRTARQYRRAARRQAWRNWWHRGQDMSRIDDYEEKRALIHEQEGILESAMQEEIRQLRAAHVVVNSIIQAEEGRANLHLAGMMAELPGIQSRPLSRTNSLPDYRSESGSSEPPAYEDDEDSSDIVVDGFREYTPSTTTVWTPDSSVIDVSPRPSGETMRVSVDRDVKN